MGRHRVRSLMRANGLRSVWKRKFIHPIYSKRTMPVSPNVLARQFEKPWPNQASVCDTTYICTRNGWLYLAAVLDLHSRKMLGWANRAQDTRNAGGHGLANGYSISAIRLPDWWFIRTGERSTQAPSIKGC